MNWWGSGFIIEMLYPLEASITPSPPPLVQDITTETAIPIETESLVDITTEP